VQRNERNFFRKYLEIDFKFVDYVS
jgi:hypothetical protein